MAAEVLAGHGLQVHLYDAMPSAGRKLLVAGRGGLNLTHSEPFESFIAHYGKRRPQLEPLLRSFGPQELRDWAGGLGIETFIGSSGRVFPVGMRSYPLLRAWLARLRASGVVFHFRHRWTGWNPDGSLSFETPLGNISVHAGAILLALGGASWPVTGSNGAWVTILATRGIPVQPLKPANCGFSVDWTEHFSTHFAGTPMKAVRLTFTASSGQVFSQRGEFVITSYGWRAA